MSRKVALVIGNNDYSIKPLKNCVNDATCLANVLRPIENCQVELKTNLKSENMYECIKNFTQSINRNDFVIFFFAGHGIQWGDQNFLLPCDNKKISTNNDMQRYGINAQMIVNDMAEMNPHIVLFLLDCCRDYWMPEKTVNSRAMNQQIGGLNQMKAPRQTLIAFACAAGEVVSDQSEDSNNGLFTKYLLKHITTPNEHIETILRRVANDVAIETGYSQLPFRVSSIISDDVYLISRGKPACLDIIRIPSKQHITVKDEVSVSTKPKKLPLETGPNDNLKHDINILLLGTTGAGKTTFINAFANYLVYNTLDEAIEGPLQVIIPAWFTFLDKDTFEEKIILIGKPNESKEEGYFDQSYTRECQSFVFRIGNRNLRLINAPGIGDTQGVLQDEKNFEDILAYIAQYEYLNGICILLKPNEERLPILFRFCVKELLRHLHVHVKQNIMFVFTKARATYFQPGSSRIILQELFRSLKSELSIEVPFSRENSFLFDNEAFRFLALLKNGIELGSVEKQNYSLSWDHSVKEFSRLMSHIIRCEKHATHDTLSLNEAQQLIRKLSRPIGEIATLIQENLRLAQQHKNNVVSCNTLTPQILPQKDAKVVPLGYPRTVCTNSNCIKTIFVNGTEKVDYASHCHRHCHLIGIEQEVIGHEKLKDCDAIDRKSSKCKKCGCGWKEHMHITYEFQKFMTNINIGTGKNPRTSVDAIEQRIKDLADEQEKIAEACPQLTQFLQVNALNPANDDILEYIQHFIREEQTKKTGGAQNDDVIAGLEKLLDDYKLKMDISQQVMNMYQASLETHLLNQIDLLPEKIFRLVDTLYRLPINGAKIQAQVEELKCVQQRFIQKKQRIVRSPLEAGSSLLMSDLKHILK